MGSAFFWPTARSRSRSPGASEAASARPRQPIRSRSTASSAATSSSGSTSTGTSPTTRRGGEPDVTSRTAGSTPTMRHSAAQGPVRHQVKIWWLADVVGAQRQSAQPSESGCDRDALENTAMSLKARRTTEPCAEQHGRGHHRNGAAVETKPSDNARGAPRTSRRSGPLSVSRRRSGRLR